jgi:hypothetical protein
MESGEIVCCEKEKIAAWIAAHPEVQKPDGAGCSKNLSAQEVASA